MDFLKALKEKVLIFDGAMGTSIHQYDLSIDDYHGYENCPEILVESRPDIIQAIHASFLEVGCDTIETNTFGGSTIVLGEFDLAKRSYELNKKAAQLSRSVANDFSSKDHPRFISGSIGPTTKLPSLGNISLLELESAYQPQVEGLIDGGVDVLQFETGQDLLQAKAAILAIRKYCKKIGREVPIITQVTIEAPPLGTMLVGTDISAALTTLSSFPISVIGLNCATGPQEMIDPLHYLCENTDLFVSVLPNAGLPENQNGKTVYKLSPVELAESIKYFVTELGVNIVGGCCGTTPEHLKKVVGAVGNASPKIRHPKYLATVASIYSSVETQQNPPPVMVGERTNTNGSKKFKNLLEQNDWDGMVSLAKEQEREGAHILDVCTAYVGRNEKQDMQTFIKRLNTEVQVPLMIDSTEFSVLETSLELIAGKPIVNSINLEDGEESMKRKIELISRYGAAAVALTIDEAGMARSAEQKLAVAKRIYDLAIAGGIAKEDIIFDALTFTLSTGNDSDRKVAIDTLNGIKLIKQHLPGVRTILGVSNISFGFDPKIRRILNSVFLHHAIEVGLDMAIVNASKILPLYKIDAAELELHNKLIFDQRTANYDPLFVLLDFYKKQTSNKSEKVSKTPTTIEEILKQRVIDGNRVNLEKDLKLALEKYTALQIINDFLLDGMKTVGELFGAGKMQLPFVLQSAETMKAAVAFLEPFMDKVTDTKRGTMVLATVKGDVHDIGKNLVDIILSNNGYNIINLGIKQPIENIIAAAQEHQADCIGMSGLLVKSTVIMKENLEILNQRGIKLPVILGGAALTRRYVEEDCRQVYQGPLFYGGTAFDDLRIMEEVATGIHSVTTQPSPPTPVASITKKAETTPALTLPSPLITNPELPVKRSNIKQDLPLLTPPFWGTKIINNWDLEEVFEYINETVLFRGQWQIRQRDMSAAKYQALLNEKVRPVLARLKEECLNDRLLTPKAIYGYFPCQSDINDLIVYHPNSHQEWMRFHFPRQTHSPYLCISDFFKSKDIGEMDCVAFQIVTVGNEVSEHCAKLFSQNLYTDYLYLHGLSVECAEALAELVHKTIRRELGFANEDAKEKNKLLNNGYRGCRYSFGYPACPNLEDQAKMFELLEPEHIGMSLSDEFQLVPEQSTSALVTLHPEARYFNILNKNT